MRGAPRIATLVSAVVLTAALAGPLSAASPELLSSKPFDVRVAAGQVTVNFTLTMSEVPSFPVKITAVLGSTEEILYEGTLSEGVYRLSAPLTKISGHGELKVVLKTRVRNRSEKGNDSYYIYQTWQGPL